MANVNTRINPTRDRVVIKRHVEKKTSGGIVIPDGTDNKSHFGEVLAVGPGKVQDDGRILEPAVKVGDKVLFGKYSGTEVELDGQQLVVMREDDIMAVIN